MIDNKRQSEMGKEFDKTFYLQCREFIKLYMLQEELVHHRDYNEKGYPQMLPEVIKENQGKCNVLLWEMNQTLQRIKEKEGEVFISLH